MLMILRDAGIPAFANGTLCQDEFAISQLAVSTAVDISVPEDQENVRVPRIPSLRSCVPNCAPPRIPG